VLESEASIHSNTICCTRTSLYFYSTAIHTAVHTCTGGWGFFVCSHLGASVPREGASGSALAPCEGRPHHTDLYLPRRQRSRCPRLRLGRRPREAPGTTMPVEASPCWAATVVAVVEGRSSGGATRSACRDLAGGTRSRRWKEHDSLGCGPRRTRETLKGGGGGSGRGGSAGTEEDAAQNAAAERCSLGRRPAAGAVTLASGRSAALRVASSVVCRLPRRAC
jgi:hypothetical protein